LLRSRVDKLENALSSLRKTISEIEKRIKTIAIGGG
jgi:prefoldin subunit 5